MLSFESTLLLELQNGVSLSQEREREREREGEGEKEIYIEREGEREREREGERAIKRERKRERGRESDKKREKERARCSEVVPAPLCECSVWRSRRLSVPVFLTASGPVCLLCGRKVAGCHN